jgi:hypothetical protein
MEEPQTNSGHLTAIIIATWLVSCGTWRVNFVSPVRAESCLILPRDTSDGRIA